jgi:hypothetical protein
MEGQLGVDDESHEGKWGFGKSAFNSVIMSADDSITGREGCAGLVLEWVAEVADLTSIA